MSLSQIFVFGSNLAGRHGRGAAHTALLNWEAVYGQAIGLQGRSYAIPTKNRRLKPLNKLVIPLQMIAYRSRYKAAIQKWPHLRAEILEGADFSDLLCGL